MAANKDKFQTLFQLKPLKPAKVSEISEATASSSIPAEERVNFHIGNPVEDERLSSYYQKCVLGAEEAWEVNQHRERELLHTAIKKSVPYAPRGGFNRKDPIKLAEHITAWLTQQQQEPLEYDLGKVTGRKEIIFSSGGVHESLRVLLHTLRDYMPAQPVKVFFWEFVLPEHLNPFRGLSLDQLPAEEENALLKLHAVLAKDKPSPVFLVLGKVPPESFRRQLRHLSQDIPLFFIEVNDAPNHLSLARESGLLNSVLRFLTPAAIDPCWTRLSISFILGNADFLKAIESVHFELKGTPAAAEMELMAYLLHIKYHTLSPDNRDRISFPTASDPPESPSISLIKRAQQRATTNVVHRFTQILEASQSRQTRVISPLSEQTKQLTHRLQNIPGMPSLLADPFLGKQPSEILNELLDNLSEPQWQADLKQAFLSSFLGHHTQYTAEKCLVVSGSARTAFSILGFHCGITEIITPDLSWTYEHCFPKVETVPLTSTLALDIEAVLGAVDCKLSSDSAWKHGAVILNNPHNASGQAFDEKEVESLLKQLLCRNIRVIDDLSYENVAPSEGLLGPRPLKKIANRLVKTGQLRRDQLRSFISVHSLSKTDCFAGARLSVIEIEDPQLRAWFQRITAYIQPNILAILLAYLFYRHDAETVHSYWILRNQIFKERMSAIERAQEELPAERNPYGIHIRRPQASMYPQLVIERLPAGISLDWLSSGLAKRGIGLIPLSTFARLEQGYDLGRKSFRLTLGGKDGAEELSRKMRRVLIDLNRIIADEATVYIRKKLPENAPSVSGPKHFPDAPEVWSRFKDKLIRQYSEKAIEKSLQPFGIDQDTKNVSKKFLFSYLPERMQVFDRKFQERLEMSSLLVSEAPGALKLTIMQVLERELHKESLEKRKENFRLRLFDRTVHPTQMYALRVDININRIIDDILLGLEVPPSAIQIFSETLWEEFLGKNIPINSLEEGDELVTDLQCMIDSEEWAQWNSQLSLPTLLSFWGDWDGSSRPSGQGHRLVAAALLENVTRLSQFLKALMEAAGSKKIDPELIQEVRNLEKKRQEFWNLLNQITSLTNQLEKRYLNVIPFAVKPDIWRRIGMQLHIAQDPMRALWQHNDRLEAKMLKLRQKRRKDLEYYFSLNKRLRKALFSHLDLIQDNLHHPRLALIAGHYRSLLKRFVLTPRIHQKMVLSLDQFAIDTTVHNMMEINEVAGKFGNPGIVLALQVSFSTDPEAFISLERKLHSRREEIIRSHPEADIPSIWVVPLFEDLKTVHNLEAYLNRLWEYSVQSRRLDQSPSERFAEMACELFIAGSDLSQQVGQPAAAVLYKQAKQTAIHWFSQKSLVGKLRIKLGSGEPMQRQGGYYDPNSGCRAVMSSKDGEQRLKKNLTASTKRSTQFAISPLRGILAGGEFRTFQSNLFEHLRSLTSHERAQIFYHIYKSQEYYEHELVRAAEPLEETRLSFKEKGVQELKMLTRGVQDEIYAEFVELATQYFRQILYGREEDVVGIHVISYFVSRSMPTLRDRPVVRPSRATAGKYEKQVVERLALTLPLAHHGSLLRAIGHNRAQSMILGVNQLSTGLFRALSAFGDDLSSRGEDIHLISDRILPFLPVQDILHSLRLYHEPELRYIKKQESAFPAGSFALLALREDIDSFPIFIGMFQKEYLRRQGLPVSEFFNGDKVVGKLLPALRPDIAVLLQPDLFNTDSQRLLSFVGGGVEESWFESIKELLELPAQISQWREKIWRTIEVPISQQVKSFVQLAIAIDKLSTGKRHKESLLIGESGEIEKLGFKVTDLFRGVMDDPMRQFLTSAVQYLVRVPEQMEKVPVEVIRALRDVEQIVRIEKQALSQKEQDLLRFYILQIARLCRENG